MQHEAQSHTALQDFIHSVGAPTSIHTDNSCTQLGKKWTKTKRDFVIKDKNTVPYSQRQNPAERKIWDIKHCTLLVLHLSGAPAKFWCYAVNYMVDILNHTAHKAINWRTPMEMYTGDTPDISNLRFSFWKDVLFLNPQENGLKETCVKQNTWELLAHTATHSHIIFGYGTVTTYLRAAQLFKISFAPLMLLPIAPIIPTSV